MPTKHMDNHMQSGNSNSTTLTSTATPTATKATTATSHTAANNKNNTEQQNSSLWNRIQTSASTLVQDAVTRPSGAALGADLAHALGEATQGKASGSLPSSGLSLSQNQHQHYPSLVGSNTTRESSSPYLGNEGNNVEPSFRSIQPHTQNGGFELDEFAQSTFGQQPVNYNYQFQYQHAYDESQGQSEGKGKGKGKATILQQEQEREPEEQTDLITPTPNPSYNFSTFNDYEIAWINAIQEQTTYDEATQFLSSSSSSAPTHLSRNLSTIDVVEQADGAAVVALLSNPLFQPGLIGSDDEYDDNNEEQDTVDMHGYPLLTTTTTDFLTVEEKKILDMFRRQADLDQEQRSVAGPRVITGRSLIPDIDTFLSSQEYENIMEEAPVEDTGQGNRKMTTLRDTVLARLPGAEDWVDVDERYHDEVWGYLRPALEAASAEIREKERATEDGSVTSKSDDGPAVRRLKMILRHMRESPYI